jgi:hypothetical protein
MLAVAAEGGGGSASKSNGRRGFEEDIAGAVCENGG